MPSPRLLVNVQPRESDSAFGVGGRAGGADGAVAPPAVDPYPNEN